jgi:hypothetical protein
MAKASVEIIQTLRNTAATLQKATTYQWGHMGACNCGFLTQEVTRLQKTEIHTRAMQGHGDWTEQLNDYCPTSGLLFDDLVSDLIAFGFDTADLKNLERLSDREVLLSLPLETRHLKHNIKQDVVTYLLAWADVLENRLLATIQLPGLHEPVSV